jgi:hypothetical protein
MPLSDSIPRGAVIKTSIHGAAEAPDDTQTIGMWAAWARFKAAPPVGPRAAEAMGRARQILAADRAVYAIIALHAAIASVALLATGAGSSFAYHAYIPAWPLLFFGLFPFVYGMLGLLAVVHRFDSRRSLAFRKLLSCERLAHFGAGLVLLGAIMIFHGTYTSIKNALPTWHGGFPYDRVQAEIDHLLHLGRDPWLYLQAATGGSGVVRRIVEWNYNQGWFILCFTAMFWVAVAKEARAVRNRYFLCYVLIWIVIGNVLAGLFLSAGPAFYGEVTGDATRFAGLLAFLQPGAGGMHSAVTVQDYLWTLHRTGQTALGSGISAFPSMHVALVTLNAIFIFERSRGWGFAAFAYVALVVASSVYLAWHYAIDGYAAVAMTLVIYATVRRGSRTADFKASLGPLPRPDGSAPSAG